MRDIMRERNGGGMIDRTVRKEGRKEGRKKGSNDDDGGTRKRKTKEGMKAWRIGRGMEQ